ncbi:MAG TPA: TolC family protein [Candidatus Polarisedimenticolaceae bacterium]|nr:TolC family protein [Candidatus Polarisedimenticolaceae bacterium]
MRNVRVGTFLVLSLGALLESHGQIAGEPPLTLEQVLPLALGQNPDLLAARLRRPVGQAAIEMARERPNPDLKLEAERETPHQAATGSFEIETGGRRARRVDVAEAELRTGEAELARLEVDVREQVRRAFYSLLAAQQTVEQAEALARLAERAQQASADRFEAGDAPRLEVIQAEVAAAQSANERDAAQAQSAAARATLNALLGRPPGQPLVIAGDPGDGSVPDPERAVELALAASPELRWLDRKIDEASARADLARAEQLANPVIEAGVTHDSLPEFRWGWRAAIGWTLPLFTRHRAAVLQQQGTLAQLHAERDAAVLRLRGDVFAAAASASALGEQSRRYRESILQKQQEVEALAEDAYRSGQTGLVSLLQALQASRQIRSQAVTAGLDYQLALARLEHAMGVPLP